MAGLTRCSAGGPSHFTPQFGGGPRSVQRGAGFSFGKLKIGSPVFFDQNDLNRMALLRDVDGTLLDIAPTPQEGVVPRELPKALSRVRDRLEGALALVSGRTIAELDEFFVPLQLVAIGGHGAEMRPVAAGPVLAGRAAPIDAEFMERLKAIAQRHPGVLVEDKGYSLALHYRKAPRQGVGLIHDVKHAHE